MAKGNFFRNLRLFVAAPGWAPTQDDLAPFAFLPCGSMQMESHGWTDVRSGELMLTIGDHRLLHIEVEKRVLPGSVITRAVAERCKQHEDETGFRPGKSQRSVIREAVEAEFRAKAFTTRSTTRVWIDTARGIVAVDSASDATAYMVVSMLHPHIVPLRVAANVSQEMTRWVLTEAPDVFTIDDEGRLVGAKHREARFIGDPNITETARPHIVHGQRVAALAMTHNSAVSFVLHDDLSLRKVKPVDIQSPDVTEDQTPEERADADFTLMAGMYGALIEDLVAALGGQLKKEA